jgi:hypothetical protein
MGLIRLAVGAVFAPAEAAQPNSNADWSGLGGVPGVDGEVYAAAVDSIGNLYVAGRFSLAGDKTVSNIAKWDGQSWGRLGSGINGVVYALKCIGNDLYAGGNFSNAGGISARCIAKWNGTAWSALSTGMNTEVRALEAIGSTLYAGGTFNSAGGMPARSLAQWDGNAWSAVGGGVSGTVDDLTVIGSNLVVAGTLSAAGSVPTQNVAVWDGSGWTSPGGGIFGTINCLAAHGDQLIAAGRFILPGNFSSQNIARWDGTEWQPLGSGLSDTARGLAVLGTEVYAGIESEEDLGSFTTNASEVRRFDGSEWTVIGRGSVGNLNALGTWHGKVVALGSFTTMGGKGCRGLAIRENGTWLAAGAGMNDAIMAFAVAGSKLYAGGKFISTGDVMANHVAMWDGSQWTPLGGGVNGEVRALAVSGSDLYVGGRFTMAGGEPAANIAKWNGSEWSTLGVGVDGTVRALAVHGGDLYAGGFFKNAGGLPARGVAKWNGSSWSAMGSGADAVYALAIYKSQVVAAGGSFANGTESLGPVVKWNGTAWERFGAGLDWSANSLAVDGEDIYAGGHLRVNGNPVIEGIAKLHGDSWKSLGAGVSSGVECLAVFRGEVYAGGTIYTIPGVPPANWPSKHIAKWDGTAWTGLGTGVNSPVFALAASGNHLYAGGSFTIAGGKAAAYFAITGRPSLQLSGNGMVINNGDLDADVEDGTEFGPVLVAGGKITRTFTITNVGGGALHLTGEPRVKLAGENTDGFVVETQPESLITAGGAATFQISFDPSGVGPRAAQVTLESSDDVAPSYTFEVQGTGLQPGEVSFTSGSFVVVAGQPFVDVHLQRTGGSAAFEVMIDADSGPASAVPPFVAAMPGTDFSDITGSTRVVAFKEDEMEKAIRIPLLPQLNGLNKNRRFTVSLSEPTNGAVLDPHASAAVEITGLDEKAPTVTIDTPKTTTSAVPPILLNGTAGDANGIRRVEVTLNNSSPVAAVLGQARAATSVPFSLPLFPQTGSNTIVVTAYDLRGNSTAATRVFNYTRRYLLRATSDAQAGAVTMTAAPAAGATSLAAAPGEPQKTAQILPTTLVKLAATAKKGFVFHRWLGLPVGAVALGDAVTFPMPTADVNIAAEWVATPFVPNGKTDDFYGLLKAEAGTPAGVASIGSFTSSLNPSGTFSGKLLIDGISQSVAGAFFGDGSAVFTTGARKVGALVFGGRTLTMSFNPLDQTMQLQVNLGEGKGASGIAERAIYSSTSKVPTPFLDAVMATKGTYNLVLKPMDPTEEMPADTFPQGSGFGTIKLTNTGAVSVSGSLADGTAITAASEVVSGQRFCLFVPLPTPGASAKKGAAIVGEFLLDPAKADSDVEGELLWYRPAAVGTGTMAYRFGWPAGIGLSAVGGLYKPATPLDESLGLRAPLPDGNARLSFVQGKLTESIEKSYIVISGNTVTKTPKNDASFTLTFASATGTFSGTFVPNWQSPSSSKPAFKGILLQKGLNRGGYGYFISNAKGDSSPESGAVVLTRQ